MNNNYLTKIRKIIEHKNGVDPNEITPESYFEDDLNISEMELIDILGTLEEDYHIDLIEAKDDIQSVGDLLELLSEKLD
jgi:acyl carrier protein